MRRGSRRDLHGVVGLSARAVRAGSVRYDAPNETLTVWQQPDENGNPVWAHSAATSLSKQHALSALDWDDLAD